MPTPLLSMDRRVTAARTKGFACRGGQSVTGLQFRRDFRYVSPTGQPSFTSHHKKSISKQRQQISTCFLRLSNGRIPRLMRYIKTSKSLAELTNPALVSCISSGAQNNVRLLQLGGKFAKTSLCILFPLLASGCNHLEKPTFIPSPPPNSVDAAISELIPLRKACWSSVEKRIKRANDISDATEAIAFTGGVVSIGSSATAAILEASDSDKNKSAKITTASVAAATGLIALGSGLIGSVSEARSLASTSRQHAEAGDDVFFEYLGLKEPIAIAKCKQRKYSGNTSDALQQCIRDNYVSQPKQGQKAKPRIQRGWSKRLTMLEKHRQTLIHTATDRYRSCTKEKPPSEIPAHERLPPFDPWFIDEEELSELAGGGEASGGEEDGGTDGAPESK